MAAPLVITAQPESITVADSQKAIVKVAAKGDGLTYQWFIAAPDSDNFTASSTVSATYSVTMNASRNGRQLYCVVTDKYGNSLQSDVAVISMETPLVITAQPESITVADGQKATVKVAAKGDGLTYQWYIANPDSDNFSKSSTTTATYSVTMNASRDGRQLYCVVTDKYGNSLQSEVAVISMKTALTITEQPESVTVADGQKAVVKVAAEGDGLKYQWYIASAGSDKFSASSTISATYSVTMNSSRDGRQLYCVVTDKYGNTVTSDIVTIEMAAPLAITSQPVSATAADGEKVSVKVVAEGEGLTYQWYIAAADSDTFSKSSITTATYSTVMNATRDGRQIYCLITDKYGNTAQTDIVTISIASELAITLQPVSVTVAEGTKAVVTLKATGDGLTYEWYYKNAGATKFTKTTAFTGTTYTVEMNAARDGRQIYCVVTDKYGNSVTSDTVTLSME